MIKMSMVAQLVECPVVRRGVRDYALGGRRFESCPLTDEGLEEDG